MSWYLIHTKPRQEKSALQNLQRQGYECYLPVLAVEKILNGTLAIAIEPLFPRYLFIRLEKGDNAKSWSPIRSTKGVSRLVTFGTEPARVDECLINAVRADEKATKPEQLFSHGDKVMLASGAFAGLEAIYQVKDGEKRALVLIEFLSKKIPLHMQHKDLRKL
jgi:transcriptional antiterminator RfaH